MVRGGVVLLALLEALPAQAKQLEAPLSRTYQIRYRTTAEFLPLVQALLSKKGTVTASRDLNILVVTDLDAHLASVDSLFRTTDRPRKQIRVTVQLISGAVAETPGDSLLPEARALIEQANYHFSAYRLLDNGMILTDSGNATTLELAGGQYGISFVPEHVAGEQAIVQLRQFTLEERVRGLRGTTTRPLIATSFSLSDGVIDLVGAAQLAREGETLFVIVSAVGL